MKPANTLRAVLSLFFLWGFLTCLNDTLLPQLKFIFNLSYGRAVAMPFTFFSTCFLLARPSARFIHRFGYRRSMVVALLGMGVGAATILGAAEIVSFRSFLLALAILGGGITLLQVAAGPYVASLGPPSGAAGRFSLALGFNSLGTMAAPLFASWFIFRGIPAAAAPSALPAATHLALVHVRTSYLLLAVTLVLLAACVLFLPLPEPMHQAELQSSVMPLQGNIFRHRPLLFGVIASFLYAGAEIGIGSLLINYLSLQEVGAFTSRHAALWVTVFWGGATAGRLLGWPLLKRFRPTRVLLTSAGGALLLVALSAFSSGYVAVAAILAVGLCNALIVPVVFMLSIAGLGERTAEASSMMVASNIGAGLTTLAMGLLADRIGLHHAFLLPCVSYAFVAFYALRGSRGHHLVFER